MNSYLIPFRIVVALPILLNLVASNLYAQTPVTLRYDFKPEQKLKYLVKVEADAKTKSNNFPAEIKITLEAESTLEVGSRDSRGNTTIQVNIDQIKYVTKAITQQIAFQLGFDTKTKKWIGDPTLVDPLKDHVRAVASLAGKSFQIKVGSRGQLKAISLPADLNRLLQVIHDKPGQDMKNELEERLLHGLLIVPGKAVAKGDTWQHEAKTDYNQYKFNFRYEGPVKKQQLTLEKIPYTIQWTVLKPPPGNAKYKLQKQDFKGTIYFDNQAGRPVEIDAEQNFTADQETNNGQKVHTEGAVKYSVTLTVGQ